MIRKMPEGGPHDKEDAVRPMALVSLYFKKPPLPMTSKQRITEFGLAVTLEILITSLPSSLT